MTHYLLKRTRRGRDFFLQANFQWGLFPHPFDEGHFALCVLPEAMQYKDRPQQVGELRGNVIEDAIWTVVA